jgi:hypothetical protein
VVSSDLDLGVQSHHTPSTALTQQQPIAVRAKTVGDCESLQDGKRSGILQGDHRATVQAGGQYTTLVTDDGVDVEGPVQSGNALPPVVLETLKRLPEYIDALSSGVPAPTRDEVDHRVTA